jgi:hypothetical protein
MSDVSNLRDTIVPKSDQLNSEQLIGAPMTITVTAVRRSTSDDQPLAIHYKDDNGRPYKPCKSMRKVLIFAWGDDGNEWVGRSMTLYNNPDIKWGGVKVGGIRISHISHVQADLALSLTATKGKKEPVIIKKMVAAKTEQNQETAIDTAAIRAELAIAATTGTESLAAAWGALPASTRTALGKKCLDALKYDAANADAQAEAERMALEQAQQPEDGQVSQAAQPDEDDIF